MCIECGCGLDTVGSGQGEVAVTIQDASKALAAFSGPAIIGIIVALGAAIGALYVGWRKYQEEIILSEKLLQTEIKNTSTLLELDSKDQERRFAKNEAEMKARNASNRQLNKENYDDAIYNYKNSSIIKSSDISLNMKKVDLNNLSRFLTRKQITTSSLFFTNLKSMYEMFNGVNKKIKKNIHDSRINYYDLLLDDSTD